MKRTAELQRKTPMKRVGFLRSSARENKAVAKLQNGMKSRGMKGRTPTVAEQAFMDRIGSLGCIACLLDGRVNPWISIHHIDGRTKPGAHFLTLPLCAPHHKQDDTDPLHRLSVHDHKKSFVAKYGTELELLELAKAKLGITNEEAA